jgi:hypothetical protein
MSSKWKSGKWVYEKLVPKPSVGKSKLHKDMAESKIKMMKDMGKFQKKVGIHEYKKKGGEKVYKKILKIDPGKP